MDQINEDNRPKCAKCPNVALTLYADLWLCGQCMHEYIQKQNQIKQERILNG